MGAKAHLARELETMIASGADDSTLAAWLRQNSDVVHESLDGMDDMVTIEQVDLADMVPWAKEKGFLTPVRVAARPR